MDWFRVVDGVINNGDLLNGEQRYNGSYESSAYESIDRASEIVIHSDASCRFHILSPPAAPGAVN